MGEIINKYEFDTDNLGQSIITYNNDRLQRILLSGA